jgi:hypothetical protein
MQQCLWTPHSAGSAVHPNRRNGSAHVPAGTSQRAQNLNTILNPSSGCANSSVEEGAGLEHRVHDHGEFPRHSSGCPLEADQLPQPEAPSPQPTLGRAAVHVGLFCCQEPVRSASLAAVCPCHPPSPPSGHVGMESRGWRARLKPTKQGLLRSPRVNVTSPWRDRFATCAIPMPGGSGFRSVCCSWCQPRASAIASISCREGFSA